MTTDFNLLQMQRLIHKQQGQPVDIEKLHIVYVTAYGDYWENRDEFVQNFLSVPRDHAVVIHVKFEALSLTHSGIVDIVQQLILTQRRSPHTVFVFSPNSIDQDSPWPNIYWQEFAVSDEITRASRYMVDAVPTIASPKTWAVFVGRRTMPRIRMLFDCYHNTKLHSQCLLSLMKNTVPETVYFWQHANRIYDSIADWIPPQQQQQFLQWYQQCPINSIDNYSVQDQYLDSTAGENRNCAPTLSLLALQNQYLFETVFETMTRGSTFTPSEKTVRAMVAHKPTVTYAPAGFLHNMRLWGFETFHDLWDESYDSLEGPPRYHAMLQIMQSVADMPIAEQIKLYQKAQPICKRNHKRLLEYQNDTTHRSSTRVSLSR